jgi:hypothetical protein
MRVHDGPGGVREGRRYVQRELIAVGAAELVDDAVLVAAELLANALQHGRTPVDLTVVASPSRVRIDVADASPRPPVQPQASTTNMTGRGLSLVQALCTRWGVRPGPGDGKTVWAELGTESEGSSSGGGFAPLLERPGGEVDAVGGEDLFPVELGDVPTDLLVAAKAHIDNLVRELSLVAAGEGGGELPGPLAALVDSVVHDFAAPRDAIKRQALAAAHRGQPLTHLTLRLPLSAADAGQRYLAALDQADAYARSARLLTVEAPEAHKAFRRWYVTALVTQLRSAAAGAPTVPPAPFRLGAPD